MCREPSELEVKNALLSIPKQSSLGPDGFVSTFYLSCWDIVKDDVVEGARDCFGGSSLPQFYSSSFIVLIPKVQGPRSFDKFRSISLYLVAYKIFSKILVVRMIGFLSQIVSPEQGAFISGRSIFYNISLAQEMVQSINKKAVGEMCWLRLIWQKHMIEWIETFFYKSWKVLGSLKNFVG